MRGRSVLIVAIALLALAGAGVSTADAEPSPPDSASAVPRADCGPGSRPETGLQGQVPLADRRSGRNTGGYSCNLRVLGRYQGEGTSVVSPSYQHCAYLSTAFGGLDAATKKSAGVQVLDVSDPRAPRWSTRLTSPAMATNTWESLKVNERRGLLAGVSGGVGVSGLFFDVYDVKDDCARPRLLNRLNLGGGDRLSPPANVTGHEGGWSPDGRTYWATGLAGGGLTAIDVADPTRPKIVYTGLNGLPVNHGFSVSDDGNRLYLATAAPAGLDILDVSDVQRRNPTPLLRQVSRLSWNVGGFSQASIPVTYHGVPHLVVFDEFASEGVRIYDLGDENHPALVKHLQLEIQRPEHVDERREDTTGNGFFGYEAHYCEINRPADPTALACGYFSSGVRVFDVADPRAPREIAYYNPPAQVGRNLELGGSLHASAIPVQTSPPVSDAVNLNIGDVAGQGPLANLSADYCSSPPRFVGADQLWVTCEDNGFLALEFTNDAYRAPRADG